MANFWRCRCCCWVGKREYPRNFSAHTTTNNTQRNASTTMATHTHTHKSIRFDIYIYTYICFQEWECGCVKYLCSGWDWKHGRNVSALLLKSQILLTAIRRLHTPTNKPNISTIFRRAEPANRHFWESAQMCHKIHRPGIKARRTVQPTVPNKWIVGCVV